MRQKALWFYSPLRIASRQKWPCQQSVMKDKKYRITNRYHVDSGVSAGAARVAVPTTAYSYFRKLLFCSASPLSDNAYKLCTMLINTKFFRNHLLFPIPRQQFGKSWMNTKVMRWRCTRQANIWQGQFSSWSFPFPAKTSLLESWIRRFCS